MNEGLFSSKEKDLKWLKVISVISYIWIAFGLVFIYAAFSVFFSGYERTQEDFFMQWVYLISGAVFSIAGIGLLSKKPWGKVTGMIGACFSLIGFPVGTIGGLLVFLGLHKNKAVYRG